MIQAGKKQYFLTALKIDTPPKYLIGHRAGLGPVIKLERKKRFRVSLYASTQLKKKIITNRTVIII